MRTLQPAIGCFTALLLLPGSVAANPRCWYPEHSPDPLIFKECYDIISQQILHTKFLDPDTPLVFSRDRDLLPDIKTPYTWLPPTGGNCVIGVDIPNFKGGTEKTSLRDIEQAARKVALECVIKPPHLGGIMQIGWQEKLDVVITGLGGPGRRRVVGVEATKNDTVVDTA